MELSIPIKVADGDGTRPSSEDGDPVPLSADIHPRVRRVRLLVVSTEHAVTVCEDRKSDALARRQGAGGDCRGSNRARRENARTRAAAGSTRPLSIDGEAVWLRGARPRHGDVVAWREGRPV